MKRSKIALASAIAVIAAVATVAVAAPKKAAEPKPVTPEQLAEAKTFTQTAGLACTVTDARYAGAGTTKTDKGTEKVTIYEVACQEKLGWIVASREKSGPQAYNCVMAAASDERMKAEGKKFGEVCQLPANVDYKAAVQAQVQRAGLTCTAAEYKWLGQLPNGDRYEVGCAEGPGYVLDVPSAPATPVKTFSCPQAAAAGLQCVLTTKDEQTAQIAAVAAKSGKQCRATDARYVAADASGNVYYELGCAEGAGFMVETDPKGAYKRAIDCTLATGIAGGCKLTDIKTAVAAEGQKYADRVKASGQSCAMTGFRRIGFEERNKRDVVELGCSDRAAGMVAFVPASGAPQVMDCLTAESRALKCELTPRASIQAVLTAALTASGKTCDVVNYKVLGPSTGDGEVVEVACSGGEKKGYIVDLPASRAKANKTLTCQQALTRPDDKCALPENV